MADLSIETTTTPGRSYKWLRTQFSKDSTISVALLRSLLQAGAHYDATGVIPSGLPLGKVTGKAEYGPYDPAADDGRQFLAGFLLEPEQLKANFGGITSEVLQVSMVVTGIIDPAFLPGTPVLDTATKTTGLFVFYGVDFADAAPTGGDN